MQLLSTTDSWASGVLQHSLSYTGLVNKKLNEKDLSVLLYYPSCGFKNEKCIDLFRGGLIVTA